MSSNSPFPPGAQLVAYLRDSGGDDQDLSVDQQEAAIRAWCAPHGHPLARIFRDTRSGTSTVGRAGFEDMLRYFAQKKRVPEAGLILWRYNRFARDLDDAQFFKAALRRRGYLIHAIMDQIPEGAAGRAVEFFIDWMADKFSEDLSIDVKRGQRHNLAQFGTLGGTPPRGFKRELVDLGRRRDGSDHQAARWVPDPDWWQTCRSAWEMRAAGRSYRQIHAELRLFNAVNSYSTFFTNRIYLGELRFGDQVLPAYVEPLVDQATWDAVQAINAKHARPPAPQQVEHPRRAASSFLLSGLARCALCGALLNGNVIAMRGQPRRGYYLCSGAHAHHNCPARRIPQQPLEEAVIDELVTFILAPANLAAILDEDRAQHEEHRVEHHQRRAEQVAQLAQVRKQITNLTNAIAATGHSPALLERLRALELDQVAIQAALGDLDRWLSAPAATLSPVQLENLAKNVAVILRAADPSTRRQLLSAFVAQITAQRGERIIYGSIDFYTPPADLLTSLGDLPPIDALFLDNPDPPMINYAYAQCPFGGTKRTHKFTAEIHRKTC